MSYEFITDGGGKDAVKSWEVRRHEAVMLMWWASGVVAVLLLCLIIIDSALVGWLNTNNGAVMALMTATFGVFNILLWHVTKQQAEIARRTFEASHRPYVTIKAVPERQSEQALRPRVIITGREHLQDLSVNILFENHGPVPATIKA